MSARPRKWYFGTTLMEAQEIVGGDYSAFSVGGGAFYGKLCPKPDRAIVVAERAIRNDDDKPAIVELTIKDRSHKSGNRIRIKSARIVPEAEILRRTGRTFQSVNTSELSQGVITRIGNGIYTVQCATGCYQCTLSGRWKSTGMSIQQVAAGDRVSVKVIDEETGVIQAIMRRTNQYGRKRAQKPPHVVATNLDGLIIVSAVRSPPVWHELLDTYLVIAEAIGIQPLICINKIDLIEDRQPIFSLLSVYEQIGYDTLITSAVTGEGVTQLQQWMKDKISVLVGLSGRGKSALLNAIQPGLQLKTREVNEERGGRHTTAGTELLKLDVGGFVADTAGIRSLSLMDVEVRLLDSYFPEMRQLRDACAQHPCIHLHEPGCAVKASLREGGIAKTRYQSYRALRKQNLR